MNAGDTRKAVEDAEAKAGGDKKEAWGNKARRCNTDAAEIARTKIERCVSENACTLPKERQADAVPVDELDEDSKKIIKTYNKVARTLVAFEYLWYEAWCRSVDTAKAGLQATLIIRHPDDGNLYVNFDQEILQLIREAKALDRMGIEIPESAKIVLLQEDKFKSYYNDLDYLLKEYERVVSRVIPVTSNLLRPHINDMEYKLRPGMVTLTWTSMNIDAYKHHIHTGLQKLEELVSNINDIIENRVEKNLKLVSRTGLVELPNDPALLPLASSASPRSGSPTRSL